MLEIFAREIWRLGANAMGLKPLPFSDTKVLWCTKPFWYPPNPAAWRTHGPRPRTRLCLVICFVGNLPVVTNARHALKGLLSGEHALKARATGQQV